MDPTRKLARLTFDGVEAELLGEAGAAAAPFARTMQQAAVCLANEMVGGAERLREDALAYAKMRMQFGRPIASFQSMKHKAADMLLEVELAKSAAYYAAAALDEGDDDVPALASLAKAAAVRGLPADRDPRRPDPWRHRLHLGQRHASLVQARQELARSCSAMPTSTAN